MSYHFALISARVEKRTRDTGYGNSLAVPTVFRACVICNLSAKDFVPCFKRWSCETSKYCALSCDTL